MERSRYVQIEPVGQCNLRCQMCPIQFRREGPPYGRVAMMPYEKFTALIDELASFEWLHLQGFGEPMMHVRLPEMIAYAKGQGIRVTNSNLTLLNERKADLLVRTGLEG